MRDFVDFELEQELAPEQAPDELWDRLCGANFQAPSRPPRSPWVATAVLTVLTVAAFSFTLNHAETTDHRTSGDVEYSCQPSAPAALTSARVVRAHNMRAASMGFELPHRSPAASTEDGCGHCHTL